MRICILIIHPPAAATGKELPNLCLPRSVSAEDHIAAASCHAPINPRLALPPSLPSSLSLSHLQGIRCVSVIKVMITRLSVQMVCVDVLQLSTPSRLTDTRTAQGNVGPVDRLPANLPHYPCWSLEVQSFVTLDHI